MCALCKTFFFLNSRSNLKINTIVCRGKDSIGCPLGAIFNSRFDEHDYTPRSWPSLQQHNKKGTLCPLKSEACIEICYNAGSRCVGMSETIEQNKIRQHLEIDFYF